jgi:phosphoenolpyruvate carboxykinase (ATP)
MRHALFSSFTNYKNEKGKRMQTESTEKEESLKKFGLLNLGSVHWDDSTPALYEKAIRRYEGMLSHLGPLVIRTGQYTGRLPKDRAVTKG